MISIIFVVVALLLLLAAVWFGLNFASDIGAAHQRAYRRVGSRAARRFDARVAEDGGAKSDDELALLGRAFNRMIGQLETQRSEVVEANRQLDERRRFTEAVLAGVSAGVIGLDPLFKINMMNAAQASFFRSRTRSSDRASFVRACAGDRRVAEIRATRVAIQDGQVEIKRRVSRCVPSLWRLSSEMQGGEVNGYVLTFDDVSSLSRRSARRLGRMWRGASRTRSKIR